MRELGAIPQPVFCHSLPGSLPLGGRGFRAGRGRPPTLPGVVEPWPHTTG